MSWAAPGEYQAGQLASLPDSHGGLLQTLGPLFPVPAPSLCTIRIYSTSFQPNLDSPSFSCLSYPILSRRSHHHHLFHLFGHSVTAPARASPARHCGGDIQECAVVPCRSSQSSRFCTWQGCQDSSPSYAAHQLCHLGFVHLGLHLLICQMGYIQSPAHR